MPTNQAQSPLDPLARVVAKYQSNGQQPDSIQPPSPLQKKEKTWTGFADKMLWDWLNLAAVLLVPLMIGVFTITTTLQENQISQQQFQNSLQLSKSQHESDQQIAADQQQATALKAYMDDMTDLLLHQGLRQSKSDDDEVRIIARAKTLTALRELNGSRKGALLQFLYEAKLLGGLQAIGHSLSRHGAIVSLAGADLSGANLSGADLVAANLSGANLSGANLSHATLSQSDLSQSDLSYATLSYATLSYANLSLANLSSANLSYATLSLADLSGADLSSATLIQADLIQADLIQANLSHATLSYADLSSATLTAATLTAATLSLADLSSANLSYAIVEKEQLAQASYLAGATLPDRSIYPSQSYPIPDHVEP